MGISQQEQDDFCYFNLWFEETHWTNTIQHNYGGELLSSEGSHINKGLLRVNLTFSFIVLLIFSVMLCGHCSFSIFLEQEAEVSCLKPEGKEGGVVSTHSPLIPVVYPPHSSQIHPFISQLVSHLC